VIVDDPRFRKNEKGRWAGGGLVLELNKGLRETEPIYTLQDYDITVDGKWYPSLYRLYMEMEDPTEFEFAKKYLGSYGQWLAICRIAEFKPYHERWQNEVILQLQSRALKALVLESQSESKNSFAANKFIIEKGWIEKTSSRNKVGRPSKEDVARAAKIEVADKDKILEDYNRLIGEMN